MIPDSMLRAIELSYENMRKGEGGPFGAVVVKNGKIIGEGWNRVTSSNDPTAHAEIVAIRAACKELGDFSLAGCEIYTSCEPCPMCLSAIYWARIEKIYFGNTRKDAAQINFDDDFLYSEIPKAIAERKIPMIACGREQAQAVFQEWTTKLDKKPY
ncbi:MAG: nucleoside deaminase [Proteobacteria bacterium]|nr:MAG: nucleoside deaminase [Pseudomonadota bacterium]